MTISAEKYVASTTFRKSGAGVMVTVSGFSNTLGHLGKGPFPYGDVGVVVTLTR